MHDCTGSDASVSLSRCHESVISGRRRFRSSGTGVRAVGASVTTVNRPSYFDLPRASCACERAMASAIFSTPKIKYAINGVDAQFAAPPSVVENQGGARGFALSISSVTARLPASSPSLPGADSVRGRITYSFFDEVGRRFFGRTHVSQAVGVTLTAAAGGSVDVSLRLPTGGEVAYAWTRFVALSSRNPAHTRARA